MELLQIPSEFAPVEKLYRDLAPQRVLEIGCWEGGTLKVWLQGCGAGATVVAIDPNHPNEGSYKKWAKKDTHLVVIHGLSQHREVIDEAAKHGPFDWVFVDGDHGDDPVRSDVREFMPMIRKGGHLVLHDITPPHGNYGTAPGAVLAELEADGHRVERFEEKNEDAWSHGLGVVHL